ncbi:hypothetical protein KKA53_02400 [Candidatus Dependentiae bacterium]|nr:hypothetical protein [Candidatus Dependentiae bacterium]
MKKIKTFLLKTLLFSVVFVAVPIHVFSNRFESVRIEEEPDLRIEQLNNVLSVYISSVEQVLGKLSPNDKPSLGFVARWNFHADGPKILRLITILEENIKYKQCSQCLNAINEIFYLQLRQLIIDLDIGQAGGLLLSARGDTVTNSQKRKTVFSARPDSHIKSKLKEILSNVYEYKNIADVALAYEYDSTPPASIMTKATINILRARAHRNWSYEKQKDFIGQKLDRAKRDILRVCGSEQGGAGLPVPENIPGFIDILKEVVIVRAPASSIGRLLRLTIVGSGALALCAAAVYGVYYVSSNIGVNTGAKLDSGLRNVAAEPVKDVVRVLEQGVSVSLGEDANGLMGVLKKLLESKEPSVVNKLAETVIDMLGDMNMNRLFGQIADKMEKNEPLITFGAVLPGQKIAENVAEGVTGVSKKVGSFVVNEAKTTKDFYFNLAKLTKRFFWDKWREPGLQTEHNSREEDEDYDERDQNFYN